MEKKYKNGAYIFIIYLFHRDLFKTHISSYQSWFDHAVMFWLQTFRSECIKRMEKSLEIEKDIVQVAIIMLFIY